MVSGPYLFRPARRKGLAFQAGVVILLLAAAGFGLWQASLAEVGPAFLLYLITAVVGAAAAPLFAYRWLALRAASYVIEREGIRLAWGLRSEDIPMTNVAWIRLNSDLERPLPMPWLRWPGSVIGKRQIDTNLAVEYMASQSSPLVLIGTPGRILAISPEDPAGFLRVYQRLTEMGSLSPIQAASQHPSFLLARFWADHLARGMVLAGLVLSLVLLAWVVLAAPGHPPISLRFTNEGEPLEYTPAVHLLLLPVLNAVFYLADLMVGLFFYRRYEVYPNPLYSWPALPYLLWSSGVITPLLFLIAAGYILSTG